MRPIDADALERKIMEMPDDELCEDCCYNVVNVISDAPTVGGWISVKDRLPEEQKSMFARFHATEKWTKAMWLEESESVIVNVAFPDGGQVVTVGKLRDGKWFTTVSQMIPHTVTHWMLLPEPPEEVTGE